MFLGEFYVPRTRVTVFKRCFEDHSFTCIQAILLGTQLNSRIEFRLSLGEKEGCSFTIREFWRFFRQARATKQNNSLPADRMRSDFTNHFKTRSAILHLQTGESLQEQSVLPLCRTGKRSFKKKVHFLAIAR